MTEFTLWRVVFGDKSTGAWHLAGPEGAPILANYNGWEIESIQVTPLSPVVEALEAIVKLRAQQGTEAGTIARSLLSSLKDTAE